jgi:predicted ABC-type ATPase
MYLRSKHLVVAALAQMYRQAEVIPPILVMFAGINGSGRSIMTQAFRGRGLFPANYINPDEIAKNLLGTNEQIEYQAVQMATFLIILKQLS